MTREYTVDTYRSRVQNNKEYDISDLVRERLFGWINSRAMYLKTIESDRNGLNILQADVTGTAKGKRYKIRGKNIIKFYKVYGPGITLLKGND